MTTLNLNRPSRTESLELSEEAEIEIIKYHMRRLIGADGEGGLIAELRKDLKRLTLVVIVSTLLNIAATPTVLKFVAPLLK